MKKLLILISIMFLFTATAEAGRTGVQFGSSGTLNLIHYGEDYGWAAGVGIGYDEEDNDVNDDAENFLGRDLDWETDSFKLGLFARKNFKVQEKTYVGLGIWGQWAWGEEQISINIDSLPVSGVVEFDRFSISPYMLVEYHLTDHLFLSAGAEIVNFSFTDYELDVQGEDEARVMDTDKTSFFEPFISLAYVF